MKPVEVDADARDEVREAIAYLETRRAGLGDEFEDKLREAFDLIARQPRAFSPYREGYRKYVVPGFSYVIYYADLDDFVYVAAVPHTSRRPDYWMNRRPGP